MECTIYNERTSWGDSVLFTQHKGVKSLSVGVLLPVGSRDEHTSEQGIAHFVEHMLFKGTRRWSFVQLLRRIEGRGAELNAFTERDHMFFYVHGIDEHGPYAIEVLEEMLAHPSFPQDELDKERNVILEEIAMYHDIPDDDIVARFYERLFPGHPLGRDILGSPSHIQRYQRKDLINFHCRTFLSGHWIWSIVGGVDILHVREWLRSISTPERGIRKPMKRTLPPIGTVFEDELRTHFHQVHGVMGISLPTLPWNDRLHLMALAHYLGGSMRSVLWHTLRERYGDVYHVSAHTHFFEDASVFYIYWATRESRLKRVIRTIEHAFRQLRNRPIGPLRMEEVRRQMQTSTIWSDEQVTRRVYWQAWEWMQYGRIRPRHIRLQAINQLTPSSLWEFVHRYLEPSRFSRLIYRPES